MHVLVFKGCAEVPLHKRFDVHLGFGGCLWPSYINEWESFRLGFGGFLRPSYIDEWESPRNYCTAYVTHRLDQSTLITEQINWILLGRLSASVAEQSRSVLSRLDLS